MSTDYGPPWNTLKLALEALKSNEISGLKISSPYVTPAFPAGSGPDFVNAAAVFETNHLSRELLSLLHKIEHQFGRQRVKRWGQRTLDLDLIAYGDEVAPNSETYSIWRDLPLEQQLEKAPSELILPHPRLQDRAFVLVPLAEIAPDWVHPVSGLSVTEMLENLPESDRNQVQRL